MSERAEHLQWCKERALAYLPADPANALASMTSDLHKHPDTQQSAVLCGTAILVGTVNDPERMRRFIKGFN